MRCSLQILCAFALLLPAAASAQTMRTFAGTGTAGYSGDGGNPLDATFKGPVGIHGDATRQIWVADTGNNRIRRFRGLLDSVVTFAGTGTAGYSGDGGAATAATLKAPTDVFVDSAGIVYVADTGNHVVRRITAAGVISTIAGTGAPGDSGDGGAATAAKLNSPSGVWASNSGVVYIADSGNHRVRRVSATGTITTYAGTGSEGFSGDGGLATAARLSAPADVYMDTAGVLYIADSGNHRIRAVAADSTITTFAGTGSAGFSGDGDAATQARLAFPRSVFVDTAGSVYIADRFNHRIRRVNPSGNITTLAGDGTPGVLGDGGAGNLARLSSPGGVWLHDGRELFIADGGNHRLRWIDDDNLRGLSGTTRVGRNAEVRLFTASFTGDGVTAVKGIRLTVSDLTTATGLTTQDLVAFRLYESPDSALSTTTDTLRGSLDAADVSLGSTFTLQTNPSPVPPAGQRRYYIVSAVLSANAVESHALKVGFPSGGLSTTKGGQGMRVRAADSARITIDVVATRLLFAVQPDGVISGNPFQRQPVIHAVDDRGDIDTDFTDTVTVTLGSGSGSLFQASTTASAGVATFSGLTYVTSVDDEAFTLIADDAAGGAEGDLPAATSNALSANTANDPPVVIAVPLNIDEDESVTLPISSMVSDVDDSLSTLTITVTGAHTTGVIEDLQLTLTPNADFHGRDTLLVAAEDPFGGSASDPLVLTVRSVNDVPTLLPLGRRQLDEDDTLSVDLLALVHDVETPAAQLRWSFLPSPGLAIAHDPGAGRLRAWAPADSAGTFTLRLTALDQEGSAVTTFDTIDVVAVNDAPRLALPAGLALARDSLLVVQLAPRAHDPDHPTAALSWSLGTTLGLEAAISGSALSLTSSPGFGGQGYAVVRATDPLGAVGADTLFVDVYSPNPQPPVLTNLPTLTVEFGDTLRQALSGWVTDADHADAVLTWTVSAATGSAAVRGDTLTYVPAGSVPYSTGLDLTVRDPDGLSDSDTLQVQVVTPQPLLAALPDTIVIGVDGGERLLDDFLLQPADGPQVTWSASAAGDLDVIIDPPTRLLRITPAGSSRAGGSIVLFAQTSKKSGSDSLTVTVANAAPRVDVPDLFLGAGESTQLLLDDFVVDDGGDSGVTWALEPLGTGLSVSLNATVRAVTLNAAQSASGPVPVRFAATDAQGAVGADTVSVTILAPGGGESDSSLTDTSGTNAAPVIGALSLLRIAGGDSVSLALDGIATDDGAVADLRWTATPGPGLEVVIDGNRRLTIRTLVDVSGPSTVRLTATDLFGARASATLIVDVTLVTDTPEPGDFNRDGRIDLVDFLLFADHVGTSVYTDGWDPIYDLSTDGRVGFDDFFLFADLLDRAQRR